MLAIQFGAGNIGRGFIACLLKQSGYDVVFADVVEDVITSMNDKHKYTVHVTDLECEDIVIDNVSAVNSTKDEIIDLISKADIITTAVGVGILPRIAPTIIKGIKHRIDIGNNNYLNIIACENAVLATSKLKDCVYEYLNEDELDFSNQYIGFANCSVDRIVPPAKGFDNNLDVGVEKYFEWNVCEEELKGNVEIESMNKVGNLDAYIERKLFTLNTGHAITAYLGFIFGKSTIDVAINDDKIYKIVKAAMTESGNGLVRKFSFDSEKHNAYIDKIINRFKNPYLKDDVARVGREPLRKLSVNDRLVKPMMTALEYGFSVDNLLFGIAAALHFNNPEDDKSVKMQDKISKLGLRDAITDITTIKDDSLLDKIQENYYMLIEN